MRRQPTADKRYDVLSRMLRDRQTEIKNKLRSLREVFPAEMAEVMDEEEQRMEEFVRDMDLALVQMEAATLRRINEALTRLDQGCYGVCGECGESISEARLRALPFAVLCRDCQEKTEGAEGGAVSTHNGSHDRVEQALSISSRNDRAPAGSQAQQMKLYDYARVLLPKEIPEEEAGPRPAPVPLLARSRRPALRASLVARGPRAARRARA